MLSRASRLSCGALGSSCKLQTTSERHTLSALADSVPSGLLKLLPPPPMTPLNRYMLHVHPLWSCRMNEGARRRSAYVTTTYSKPMA